MKQVELDKLDELDLERDIEELRRLARALHAQNHQLIAALAAKICEVERLRGKPGDLQLTLKMLESRSSGARTTTAPNLVAAPRSP